MQVLAAAGSAGIAALLCYILIDDADEDSSSVGEKTGAGGRSNQSARGECFTLSKQELQQLLAEMIENQEQITKIAKQIPDAESLDFDGVYEIVKAAKLPDPLQSRGLSMDDLQEPIERNIQDPLVADAVQKLMGGGGSSPATDTAAKDISVDTLTNINDTLVGELDALSNAFRLLPQKAKYEADTIMVMIHAVLDSKITRKYGLDSSDIQTATMKNQQILAQNKSFVASHEKVEAKTASLAQLIQFHVSQTAG